MQLETDNRLPLTTEVIAAKGAAAMISKTPEELAHIVSNFVLSDGWIDRVRLRTEARWYERLYLGPDYDIWVISWLPGQSTGSRPRRFLGSIGRSDRTSGRTSPWRANPTTVSR